MDPQLLPSLIAQAYPGINGILGTRASMMMDLVVLSMVLVLPIMGVSIALVRYRRQFLIHKRIQLTLGIVLLIAVALFEVDIQYFSKWELRAAASPYFNADNHLSGGVGVSLIVHLFFAVPTLVLWIYVIVMALRRFPNPPLPGSYSSRHIFWSRLAAGGMGMTAITGWLFYYLAFVCS